MIELSGIERVFVVGGEEVHALRSIDLAIGKGEYLSIMGPSGSGKSTLVQDVLYAALRKALGQPTETPGKHDSLYGADQVGEVVMVDQSSIGRTTPDPLAYWTTRSVMTRSALSLVMVDTINLRRRRRVGRRLLGEHRRASRGATRSRPRRA